MLNTVKVTKAPMYIRLFNKESTAWDTNQDINMQFLRKQQRLATEFLKEDRILLLNTVYTMLGLPKTKFGQHFGWVYNEHNPVGDNYVDFGIDDFDSHIGINGAIVLNFNIDGKISELI